MFLRTILEQIGGSKRRYIQNNEPRSKFTRSNEKECIKIRRKRTMGRTGSQNFFWGIKRIKIRKLGRSCLMKSRNPSFLSTKKLPLKNVILCFYAYVQVNNSGKSSNLHQSPAISSNLQQSPAISSNIWQYLAIFGKCWHQTAGIPEIPAFYYHLFL